MSNEKYILTTEELIAWKNEIRDVKKLEQEERETVTKVNGDLPKIEGKKFNSDNLTVVMNSNQLPSNILKFGDPSGINSNMQKSITKGEYKIDARLDLHGYSRNEDITMEQLYKFLNKEIPYNLKVETESWKETQNDVTIHQVITVLKDSQKKIILGTNGENIKKISIISKREMEKLTDKKIHLYLFIKVRDTWMDKL